MKALSQSNSDPQRASRPFDLNRDGFVLSEGSGMLVLESETHAKNRGAEILAELAGYGASDDAFHITQPSPGGIGAYKAMEKAIKNAKLNIDQIDYIKHMEHLRLLMIKMNLRQFKIYLKIIAK